MPSRFFLDDNRDYAIYMLYPSGKIASWNSSAEKILGHSPEEAVGMHFSRFYIEEDRTAGLPAKALEMASREGRLISEGWRLRKDGSKFRASVAIDAIRDNAGALIGFTEITQDLTVNTPTEEAFEQTGNKLLQAQRMEAVGKLTGGIAHDFNNLLSIIMNGIEILSHESLKPGSVKVLDGMRRAAEKGSTLTRQLLSLTRQRQPKQERQDINKVIGGFESLLRRACDASIGFNIRLAPKLSQSVFDASQFENALLNLTANARDALPDGGDISISTENVEVEKDEEIAGLAPGRYARISVSGTGAGMTPSVVGHAFEPFSTTKPSGKGMSMGLSQVRGFAAKSGGGVALSSETGNGSTVSIYLPAAEAANADPEARTSSYEKVLIVDDEADVLTVATELFRNMDYDVVTAKDGLDALDILHRSKDISIVFTDVVMPRMNGIELARRTRELFPDKRVIIASGFPQLALSTQYGNLAGLNFVSKPYRFSELARMLRTTS